jgi:hypothetical protein
MKNKRVAVHINKEKYLKIFEEIKKEAKKNNVSFSKFIIDLCLNYINDNKSKFDKEEFYYENLK